MEELNVEFDREGEVIRELDGVVGWLTLFGNLYAVRGLSFETALKETINQGKEIMQTSSRTSWRGGATRPSTRRSWRL